jgi:hypothetical protein
MSAKPATPAAAPAPAAKPAIDRNEAIMFGGGALALIALAAAAIAMARRRRRREEMVEATWYEPEAEPEPAPQPAPIADHQPPIVAPAASAFAWDKEQPCDNPSDDGSDRCPGETWVERAHRGPSPANPSVSLKTRLSRAAFFDKRERDVAAGKAEPIDPDAGLPEAVVDEQEREQA